MMRLGCVMSLLCAMGCGGAPPAGETGPAADAVAKRMVAAVHGEAWAATGAVRWTFAGRHEHLWDRERSFARVKWGDHRVLVDLTTKQGRAWDDGVELQGEDLAEALDDAHAKWVNDAFWLNPVVKVFDDGVERARVVDEGQEGLRVTYRSGGRTPGDTYLWWLAKDGTPVRWQMWTSNVPVDGAKATWEGWVELASGARVSTRHSTAVFDLELTDVAGTRTLAELEPGGDPFALLVAGAR